MFQFRAFPSYAYLIQRTIRRYCLRGFPHSEISGSTDICSSPKLIAACHVLRRLLMPRHSPCALYSLTSSMWTSYPSQWRKRHCSLISSHLLSACKHFVGLLRGKRTMKSLDFMFHIDISLEIIGSLELCRQSFGLFEIVLLPTSFQMFHN